MVFLTTFIASKRITTAFSCYVNYKKTHLRHQNSLCKLKKINFVNITFGKQMELN